MPFSLSCDAEHGAVALHPPRCGIIYLKTIIRILSTPKAARAVRDTVRYPGLCFITMFLCTIVSALTAISGGGECDLARACSNREACPALSAQSPELWQLEYETTAGNFTVEVHRDWAPPFADRFFQLALAEYHVGASFYRVDYINESTNFVVQFGYRGDPTIDTCWDADLTSNATWSVHAPGNTRGTLSMSMNAVPNPGTNPNCTSSKYCAVGFSTNVYINYGNNTRLDPSGFAIFATVVRGLAVVDRLYSGYGEVADLCQTRDKFTNLLDPYCKTTPG